MGSIRKSRSLTEPIRSLRWLKGANSVFIFWLANFLFKRVRHARSRALRVYSKMYCTSSLELHRICQLSWITLLLKRPSLAGHNIAHSMNASQLKRLANTQTLIEYGNSKWMGWQQRSDVCFLLWKRKMEKNWPWNFVFHE